MKLVEDVTFLKDKVLHKMQKTLSNLQFLDELKNFNTLQTNSSEIRIAFNNLFRDRVIPVTAIELTNAISYITEDISIAEYIYKQSFELEMDGVQQKQAAYFANFFLGFYQTRFSDQLKLRLRTYQNMECRKDAIKQVRECILFVLKKKVLNPDLQRIDLKSVIDVFIANMED